jgi:hypothetical protein
MHLFYVGSLFILGLSAGIGSIVIARRAWGKEARGSERTANLALLFMTCLTIFIIAELLYYAFPQTDGFEFTKSHKLWKQRYWGEVNELGFRDTSFGSASADSDHLIVALGDSFTAGNGVNDVADRFSNVVADALGPPWRVANVAQPGWHTVNELEALRDLPVQPRLVILAYFLNDLDHAVVSSGGSIVEKIEPPSGLLALFVNHSYAINDWYWRLYRLLQPRIGQDAFIQRLCGYYEDDAIWEEHKRALLELISHAQRHGTEILVVYFPQAQFMEENTRISNRVLTAASEAGANVLDLTPLFQDRDPRSIVVNAFDGHYNSETHREIGGILAKTIAERKLLAPRRGAETE